MDPLSMIVAAIAAGASAALKPTATQLVKDAYEGIKTLLLRKYGSVDLTPIEKKPQSEDKRGSLREDLKDAGVDGDQELIDRVKELLDAIEKDAPAEPAAIGIDLKEVKAQFLKAHDVIAEGTGVKVEKSEFSGGIDISNVRAGTFDNPKNP